MKKSYEALRRVGSAVSLPLEFAAGAPKVEIEGFSTVRIENHHGVLEYGDEAVELGAAGARIRVSGGNLGLKSLSSNLAVITGRIKKVEYLFGEEGL